MEKMRVMIFKLMCPNVMLVHILCLQLIPGLRHMPHKLERPSAALALPAKSDLRLVGHGRGRGGGVIVIPARHGRGRSRLPPHPGAHGHRGDERERRRGRVRLARDQILREAPRRPRGVPVYEANDAVLIHRFLIMSVSPAFMKLKT